VHEGGIGSGTRRIEALTGEGVVEWYRTRERELEERIAEQDARIRALEADLKKARSSSLDLGAVAATAQDVGSVTLVAQQVDVHDMDELLSASDTLKARLGDASVVVLGAAVGGKALLVANVAPGAVDAGVAAGDIIAAIAPSVGGGGGGRPTMARAGGKNPDGLPDALRAAGAHVAERVG